MKSLKKTQSQAKKPTARKREVLHNRHPDRIRLSGIDCPEKGQAYGHQAKQATSAMVFGKEVILQTHGRDKAGRTLADVLKGALTEDTV